MLLFQYYSTVFMQKINFKIDFLAYGIIKVQFKHSLDVYTNFTIEIFES